MAHDVAFSHNLPPLADDASGRVRTLRAKYALQDRANVAASNLASRKVLMFSLARLRLDDLNELVEILEAAVGS